MKKQLFLLFSVLLGYSELSFAYDPTRGALQNAPELRSYGYNQQDIYNKYHPSVNVGNSYNNNGNSYNNMNPVIIHVPSMRIHWSKLSVLPSRDVKKGGLVNFVKFVIGLGTAVMRLLQERKMVYVFFRKGILVRKEIQKGWL